MDNSTEKCAAPTIATIDLRGLRCPLPAIRCRKILLMPSAQSHFAILITDSAAVHDVPLAVQDLGWTCLSAEPVTSEMQPTWKIILEKAR
jgi:tRNA 2-thiouridine synthesizing protein A